MMQLLFFAISSLILLLGHFACWYVVIGLFQINFWQEQVIVGAILFLFFISIVFASYLIHKWDNFFTRWYYIFAGLWAGLLVNLVLMATLILIIKFSGQAFNFNIPAFYFKIIFVGGASLVSFIGIYRAWNPSIVEYEVAIKDLPSIWDGKVIVQISDVHLGPVYREKFFSRVINKIKEIGPEAVFITGDLFDGMEADFSWLNNPFKKLTPPQGIYYGFGNHDLYLGFDRVSGLLQENSVKILDNRMLVVDGLQIIGINYSFEDNFDLAEAILRQVGYDEKLPSILLFHAPKNIEMAKRAGIDLQLSGHTHDGQMFPFNLIAKLAHSGYGYGLFREGDFSLVVNGGVGTWGPPMRTAARGEIVKIILKKK